MVKVRHDEGVANRIGPEPCVGVREGVGEASAGERTGQPSSRESYIPDSREIRKSRTPTPLIRRKATRREAPARAPGGPARSETLACVDAPCAGTGRSPAWPAASAVRSASGRRGAEADDARAGEVRPLHSSCEADEQSRVTGGGAGGAKGGGQGKHTSAAHAPGSGPGKRVTGAGACTESGTKPEDGTVHLAPPSPRPGHVADDVLCSQAGRGRRRGRADMTGLRGRSRSQDRRSAPTGPARSLSGAAGPAAVHPEAGRATAPARDRGPGGQDRPKGHGGGAERDL